MPSREYLNRRMWVRASLPVSSTHTKYSHGNCNTWVMNAVLNSIHLSLATCCTFFLVNPFLRNTQHTVLPDTITPVASYIAWHVSHKYRDRFSCIIAIMNSSWWLSSFRASSLRGCFSGATFPVSLNLEKMRCAVLGAELSLSYLFKSWIHAKSLPYHSPSNIGRVSRLSCRFSTQSTQCSSYYQLAEFEYPALEYRPRKHAYTYATHDVSCSFEAKWNQ